jgi:hypothetical protein
MGLTEWAETRLLLLSTLCLLFGTVLTVSVLGIAGWLVAALFLGARSGVASVLAGYLPWFVLGVVAGLPLTVVASVGIAAGLFSKATGARGSRTNRLVREAARFAERHHDGARMLGLSEYAAKVDTRTDTERARDELDRLKERYVDGDLSEAEYERRLQAVLDGHDVDPNQVLSSDEEREREFSRR